MHEQKIMNFHLSRRRFTRPTIKTKLLRLYSGSVKVLLRLYYGSLHLSRRRLEPPTGLCPSSTCSRY